MDPTHLAHGRLKFHVAHLSESAKIIIIINKNSENKTEITHRDYRELQKYGDFAPAASLHRTTLARSFSVGVRQGFSAPFFLHLSHFASCVSVRVLCFLRWLLCIVMEC